MEAKKLKRYLKPREIRDLGVVGWSDKTFDRRRAEGLPAIKDAGGWLYDLDDLDKFMKERKVYDGQAS